MTTVEIALPEEYLVMADLSVSFDLVKERHLSSSLQVIHVNNRIASVTYDNVFVTPHYWDLAY